MRKHDIISRAHESMRDLAKFWQRSDQTLGIRAETGYAEPSKLRLWLEGMDEAADRIRELEQHLRDRNARIRELEKIIHERDLDIVELAEDRNEWIVAGAAESRRAAEAERKLADRDAAWEEAIQLNYDQTFGLNVDGFIIVVRRWIENKGGKM